MKIIESVRNYILTCPHLAELSKVNVDFLPDDPTSYSIEEIPARTIISTYLDGSTERQFVFVFACRLNYSDELRNNIDNSGFFENVYDWLEDNSENNILPIMGEGLIPTKIEAMTSGYLFDINGSLSNARYQIQCRLVYEKE